MYRLSLAGLVAALMAPAPATAAPEAPATAAPESRDPAAYYPGWRVFQMHCARCHGSDAAGTASAPNLLARMPAMSEERFIGTVLRRYQWVVPSGEAAREGAAREALIRDVLRRQQGELQMPAWEGEPSVRAHIGDLYTYLGARASGALGPTRPDASADTKAKQP